ncbi:MAG: hypothetical protein R8K53_07500 [Mariprofundaceae bacterium]
MRVLKFFVGIPLGFLLMAGLWSALFYLQLGVPTLSSQWVDDVVQEKTAIAHRIQPNAGHERIVFLGGSNVLFGVDAGRIAVATGIPSVNFGLSAVLRVDQIFDVVKKNLKPHDTLILALEYSYYHFNENFSVVEMDYILAHDVPYFRALALDKQALMMAEVSAIRLLGGLAAKVFPVGKAAGNYKAESIDAYGTDTSNARANMPEAYVRHMLETKPASHRLNMEDRFWPLYKDFLQWCAVHQVRVLVSFPSYLHFPEYEKPEQRKFFDGIVAWHRQRKIPLLGTPDDFMYDYKDMYDTRWHLNDEGRRKRTDKIIALLNSQTE